MKAPSFHSNLNHIQFRKSYIKGFTLIIILFIQFQPVTLFGQEKEKDPFVDSILTIYNSKVHDTVKLDLLETLTKYLLNNDLSLIPKYCSLGIDLARKLKMPNNEGAFVIHLGTKDYYEGNYEKAIESFFKAYNLSESVRNELGMANALNNIGIMYYLWKNYTKALEYLDKSMVMYKKLGKEEAVYRNRSNAGVVYLDTRQWDKALESFNNIMVFYEKNNNEFELAKAYNNTATAYLGLEKYAEAEKYLFKSFELNNKLNNKHAASVNLYNLARIYNELGQYTRALKFLDESRIYPEENKLNRSLILIMKLYSEVYENSGDFKKAFDYYKNYEIIKDTIYNAEKLKQITEIQTKYETERTSKENEYLTQQAKKQKIINQTLIVAILFFSLTAILAILFLISKTRSNRKLRENQAELKDLNTQLEKAKIEAEKANNLKSAFLANISHEIRTPLNAIIGFTNVLQGRLKSSEDIQLLRPIEVSGKNLLALLNDILDISKIEANKLSISYEPLNLRQIINDTIDIFHPNISEKELDLELNWDHRIPEYILSDEIRIRQILFNLIGNAIKFTDHGKISISATLNHNYDSDGQINFRPFVVSVAISDTGTGIEPEQQSHIFQPFTQLATTNSKKMGGTGLGLAISRKLAEILDGEITLKSNIGEGSTFTLILKKVLIANKGEVQENELKPFSEMPDFRQATLLVIDDEKFNRELFTHFLKNTRLRIVEAKNGKEGYLLAGQIKPDLIFVDLRMPITDGREFLVLIRQNEQLKNIPVICVTASIADNEEKKILQKEFNGVLLKPLLPDELVKILINSLKPHF